MFSSIRWRLVASYILLTLLTVAAIGMMGLGLVQRYVAHQEREFLNANAQAVARGAVRFIGTPGGEAGLQQLAQTAAFLGDIDVQIFDVSDQILAASSSQAGAMELAWLVQAPGVQAAGGEDEPVYVFSLDLAGIAEERGALPHLRRWHERLSDATGLTPGIAPHDIIMIQRSPSMWGNRLTFEQPGTFEQRGADGVLYPAAQPGAVRENGFASTDTITGSEMLAPAVAASPATSIDGGQTSLDTRAPERGTMPGMGRHPALAQMAVAPIQANGEEAGYVSVSRTGNFQAEPLAALGRLFLLAAAGATVLATVIGLGVSRGLTAPVQSLAHAAARMQEGDLSARAPVHSRDELGALAQQFNRMATQLQSSFDALHQERDTLRRFVADASHELRTPATALRTFTEILQGNAGDDPATRAEFLRESQSQLERMEWITRNLLDLSRLDAGLATLDLAEHDLHEAATTVAAQFQSQAQARKIDLALDLPDEPVCIVCDGTRIEMALRNLVENALKFTPAGGKITLGVGQTHDQVRLWVEDSGVGIDPADLPHVFERFYRSARTRQEGSGLGLAIVQSVIHAHGGRVHVESSPGAGSRFEMVLPQPQDPV